MTTHTTAMQALEQARAVLISQRQQTYEAQVAAYRPAAEAAFHDVITPWWAVFSTSLEAAQIRHRLAHEDRLRVAIADPVRYLGPQAGEWEAVVMLEREWPARKLLLTVQQLRGGRPVRSAAGALLAHHLRRTLPVESSSLGQLDLHPIVIIDFAEQVKALTVAAYVTALAAGR